MEASHPSPSSLNKSFKTGQDTERKFVYTGCCSRGPRLKSIAREYLRPSPFPLDSELGART